MGEWFPDWEYYDSVRMGEAGEPLLVRVWEGELAPLPAESEEAAKILSDLNEDRTVLVERGGVLKHDPHCTGAHGSPDAIRNHTDFAVGFRLMAEHPAPPAHPKVYALRPRLGAELFHTQGHVNGDGSLCPFFPPDGEWDGTKDTLAKYLRAGVSILLAKHLYWQWTREVTGAGIWPGARGPHGRFEAILESLQRSLAAQCRCGSGKPYADCHQEVDRQLLSSASALLSNLGRR